MNDAIDVMAVNLLQRERIDELEADRERLRSDSIDMGKYVWVETETWDSVMHKEQEHE